LLRFWPRNSLTAMHAGLLFLVLVETLVLMPGGFAQSSSSAMPVPPSFKVGATNVLVDIVVTGPHGAPVDGLSQDSFSVFENGHMQKIVSFEAHSPSGPKTLVAAPALPAGVYSNAQALQDSDTADVLLIDALNTPTDSQVQAHKMLVAYLKTLPIDKPVAVFTLDQRLRLLEDFTADHTALLSAVEEFTGLPQKSPLLKTPQDTADQMKAEDDKIGLSMAANKPNLAHQLILSLQQFNAEQDSFNISLRVRYTLAAFDQLARYLSGMPGRKNVVWISGSFPLSILPDSHLKDPFQAARDFSVEVDRTANLLANARVAIYPIDARGLFPQSLSNPSISGGTAVRNPDRVAQAESAEFSLHAEESMNLDEVARATGGEAIYNTNDLKSALAEVDRNGAHYYSLAYIPSDKSQDNKLRRIEVRVRPGKYHLSYRRSYAPAEAPRQDAAAKYFGVLMQHSIPASTQIMFRLSPMRVTPQPESGPIAGSNPNTRRPVTRYSIQYDVDVAPLVLTASADGVLHGNATILAIAYDRDGKALNSVTNTLNINVPSSEYSRFMKAGIRYREQLDIPAQAAWLRAGIFDPSSGRVGSLEVPFSVAGHP
jgi:VWFA-related protein